MEVGTFVSVCTEFPPGLTQEAHVKMAARLLRLSSFKGLQADRWGLLRTHSAVSFCTRTEDPTKPGKKKKAAVKTAEAPDLRESLLAYNSTVGFPVRTPQPAVLLSHSVGDTDSASTSSSSSSSSFPAVAPSEVESKAAASSSHPVQVLPDGASRPAEDADGEEVDTAAVPAAATESGDPAAGETSSSSDSESDSDSESEDEKNTSAGPATSPEPQQSSAEKEEHSPELTKEQAEVQGGQKVPASSHVAPPVKKVVHEGSGGSEELEPPKPSSPQTSAEGVEKVAEEVLEDDAPPVSSAISEASSPSLVQAAAQDKMQAAGPAEHPSDEPAVDIPEASVNCLEEAVEEPTELQNLSAQPPEAQSEASSPAGVTEELVDPGQSLKGAGELQLEEAPAPEPEPEEPFDNGTYKNYQHHSYNPYTFADLDLEMAKYRLPQPSSGRPSPRH